jgi:hypothetical protein
MQMSRDQFVRLLRPAMDLVDGDDDARIYISETSGGGLLVKARHHGELYEKVYPADDGNDSVVRSCWYSPAWLKEMFINVQAPEITSCNIYVQSPGLRVTALGLAGPSFEYIISAHVCKTQLLFGGSPAAKATLSDLGDQ